MAPGANVHNWGRARFLSVDQPTRLTPNSEREEILGGADLTPSLPPAASLVSSAVSRRIPTILSPASVSMALLVAWVGRHAAGVRYISGTDSRLCSQALKLLCSHGDHRHHRPQLLRMWSRCCSVTVFPALSPHAVLRLTCQPFLPCALWIGHSWPDPLNSFFVHVSSTRATAGYVCALENTPRVGPLFQHP